MMTALRLIGVRAAGGGRETGGTIHCAGLCATVVPAGSTGDTEAVKAHHRAVVAECRDGPFLPAPFGVDFDGPSTIREGMRRGAPVLFDTLDRIGSMAEWSLRLTLVSEPPAVAGLGEGRAFLMERQAAARREAAMRHFAEQWRDGEVAGVIRRLKLRVGDEGSLSASLLVERPAPRAQIEASALALFTRLLGDAGLPDPAPGPARLSGPWPVYSFAGLRNCLVPAPEAA